MLSYTLIIRVVRLKTRVISTTVLLLVLLWYLFAENKKEEKVTPLGNIYAAIHYYPLPIKNLRTLIESTGKGRQLNPSDVPLNPDFANLEFNPLSVTHCSPNDSIGLLILIKSSLDNNLKRATFRAMWANEKYLNHSKIPIKYAFFVGVGQLNGSYSPKLLEEITLKHDLVLIEYIDAYRNNTLKTMAMMKWAFEHCPNHEFVITMDDDVYLSITNLMKFLQRRPQNYLNGERDSPSADSKYRMAISPDEFLYAGLFLGGRNTSPTRSRHSKWSLSWNDYPFEVFPDYATGAIVIYTRKTYRYIHLASSFVKYLEIDDVYIGIVAGKLGIKPTVLAPYISCNSKLVKNETAIGIHRHGNPNDLLQYWMKPHNDARILKDLTSY